MGIEVFNGSKMIKLERMKVYELPDSWATGLILEGFACKWGFLEDLPLSKTFPKDLKGFNEEVNDAWNINLTPLRVGGSDEV